MRRKGGSKPETRGGRGGRLAELSFPKKTPPPLFYLQSIYKGRALRFRRSLVARQLPVSPLSCA